MSRFIPLLFIGCFLILSVPTSVHAQNETPDCTQFHPAAQRQGDFCLFPELPELNFINSIEPDEAGRIWVATDGRGLNLIENGTVRNWQPETSDIREDAIRGFAVRNDIAVGGFFGCGGCGGVGIYDLGQDTWTDFWPEESELSAGGVGGVAIDGTGRIYMPTGNQTLDIWDGTEWQHFAPPETSSETFQRIGDSSDAVFDKNGVLWVGYYDGLWKFDGTTWGRAESSPTVSVNALVYDAERELLWIAGASGLFVGNEKNGWKQVPSLARTNASDPNPNADWFEDVALDSEGRVWVIGNKVLAVFNGVEWERYDPSLLDDEFASWGNSLAFDENGNLWLESGLIGRVTVYTGETTLAPSTATTLEMIEGVPPPEYAPIPIVSVSPFQSWRVPFLVASGVVVCLGIIMFIGIVLYLRRPVREKPVP